MYSSLVLAEPAVADFHDFLDCWALSVLLTGIQPGVQILEFKWLWDHRGQLSVSSPDFLIQQVRDGWDLRICIFNKFPDDADADAAGLDPCSENLDREGDQKVDQHGDLSRSLKCLIHTQFL